MNALNSNLFEENRDQAPVFEESVELNAWQKILRFIKNNSQTLIDVCCTVFLALFIFTVFGISLYLNGMYPFGKATMSSYDMLAQVAPYIEHFFDVIDGKSSLFYSYSIAGGADVFGTLAYCCVSPFTFVFLLFGRGNVYYGTAIVLPLKVACVAISAYFYLKKRFKNLNPFVSCALALSYAYCGYLFVSNTYINWVDLLIWLPIVALGFKKIVEGGKKRTFIIGLSLMIYTCFSISCFALLIVFPIIIVYCLTVVEKSQRKKTVSEIVIALCLTIVVCLPILVPSLWAFLVSGRKTGLFDNLFNDIKADPLYKKSSYLFTDGFTLAFTFAYFYKNGVKRPIDRFLAISAIFVLAPVFVDEVCNLLNFGSYMSYSLRFGFLNGFYFLFIAALFFEEYFARERVNEQNKATPEADSDVVIIGEDEQKFVTKIRKNLKPIIYNCLFGFILLALLVGAVVGVIILNKHVKDGSFVESFSGRFAHSLGGLEVTAIICGIVALIALYAYIVMHFNKLTAKIVLPILLVVVCGQSVFYTPHLVVGNKYTPTRYEQIGSITDYVKKIDGHDRSRVRMNGDYLTADMPFTLKTNAFTVFSSVTDSRNFVPTTFFGYGGNGINTMKSYNGSIVGDCILGYKYLISDQELFYKYLDKVMGDDEFVLSTRQVKVGSYYLYENKYVFPSAFTVFSVPNETKDCQFDQYKDLMYSLTGREDGLTVLDVHIKNIIEQPTEGVFRVKNELKGAGTYFMYFDFPDYDSITYNRGMNFDAEKQTDLPEKQVLKLGYGTSGSYSVCLKSKTSVLTAEYIQKHVKTFCVLDSTLEEIALRGRAEEVEFDLSAGKITAKANGNGENYLMLNYVSLPGHTVKVNGKVQQLEENFLNLCFVKLENGENLVEITYQSPYVKAMLLSVIVAVAILAAYYFIIERKRVSIQKLYPTITVCAYGLALAVTLFFFVMPTCVFLYKLAPIVYNQLLIPAWGYIKKAWFDLVWFVKMIF